MRPEPLDDVLINGAGIVGAACALLLAQSGLRVRVTEAGELPEEPAPTSPTSNVLAITPASQGLLQEIGVWDTVTASPCGVFEQIRVWDENGDGRIEFHAADAAMPCLGHIIETPVLVHALRQALRQADHIAVMERSEPVAVRKLEDHVELELDHGRVQAAKLLLAADGTHSAVRRLAHMDAHETPYPQTALTVRVRTALPHGNVARQRFLRDGILAFLPLADPQRCVALWFTEPRAPCAADAHGSSGIRPGADGGVRQ